MNDEDGGYLVPAITVAEMLGLSFDDPRPSSPSWWKFWCKSAYRKADAKWRKRWSNASIAFDANTINWSHVNECNCNERREVGQHWFCPIHHWMMKGLIRTHIHISHELAKDFGWIKDA